MKKSFIERREAQMKVEPDYDLFAHITGRQLDGDEVEWTLDIGGCGNDCELAAGILEQAIEILRRD